MFHLWKIRKLHYKLLTTINLSLSAVVFSVVASNIAVTVVVVPSKSVTIVDIADVISTGVVVVVVVVVVSVVTTTEPVESSVVSWDSV